MRHVCTVAWKESNRFTITVAVGPTPKITTADITFTSLQFKDVRATIKENPEIRLLNLCDQYILMIASLVFVINYDKSQTSPPVPPVSSVVCTWGGSDTPNIDVRVDVTDRDYIFNVVYSTTTATTVNLTVNVPHVKNPTELRLQTIVSLVEKAIQSQKIPRPVRLSMTGMIYSLCYVDLTTPSGCPLREFKGFSIQHQM